MTYKHIESALEQLKKKHRIFHSEADFQFSLAWELQKILPTAKIRLEYCPSFAREMHIDIYVIDEDGSHPIELKYKSRDIELIDDNEYFKLKNHGAQDIGRYDYLYDTGELKIVRQLTTKGISTPKTKSSIRSIFLPRDMVELLIELKKNTKSEWMFPSPVKNGKPRHPSSITKKFRIMLERANCKHIRFHDLRHTFATMALENGIDIKTLSSMIGHVSSETTLNIYSHVTDTMRVQASVKIDREIGGTNAQMPEFEEKEPKVEQITTNEKFEPSKPKHRKNGTGCITMINDHLYEGRYTPCLNRKRISKNVYAKTREECEQKLSELIVQMKAEIAKLKKKK